MKNKRSIGFVARATALVFSVPAIAQDAQRLPKADVETLVTGKKIEYLRSTDSATIGWDFRSGGDVFYTTSRTQRNIAISGKYTIEDDGAVCFKWNQDKNFNVPDGCVLFTRDATKTRVVGHRNPERIIGEVQ
jgi:hypothetical protein